MRRKMLAWAPPVAATSADLNARSESFAPNSQFLSNQPQDARRPSNTAGPAPVVTRTAITSRARPCRVLPLGISRVPQASESDSRNAVRVSQSLGAAGFRVAMSRGDLKPPFRVAAAASSRQTHAPIGRPAAGPGVATVPPGAPGAPPRAPLPPPPLTPPSAAAPALTDARRRRRDRS